MHQIPRPSSDGRLNWQAKKLHPRKSERMSKYIPSDFLARGF